MVYYTTPNAIYQHPPINLLRNYNYKEKNSLKSPQKSLIVLCATLTDPYLHGV